MSKWASDSALLDGTARWRSMRQRWQGEDVLVIGNGPSRKSLAAQCSIRDFRGKVIACNAYWRAATTDRIKDFERSIQGANGKRSPPPSDHRLVGRPPDALVCFDPIQVAMAQLAGDWPIICPHPSIVSSYERVDRGWLQSPRIAIVSPFSASYKLTGSSDKPMIEAHWIRSESGRLKNARTFLDASWRPTDIVVGNLSGLIAFQAAIHFGARSISMIGIDASGTRCEDGGVDLSACLPDWEGYVRPTTTHLADANPVADGEVAPRSWDQYRTFWRVLTTYAEMSGITCRRLLEAGSLDWVPVAMNGGAEGRNGVPSGSSRLPDIH